MKKSLAATALTLSLCMVSSTAVFANPVSPVQHEENQNNIRLSESNNKIVSISDIIPREFLDKYRGKYNSYDEVYKAFGMQYRTMSEAEEEQAQANGGLEATNADELAAYLAYYEDLKEQNSEVITGNPTNTDNPKANSVESSAIKTRTDSRVIYDNMGVYWIKAFITIDYNTPGGHITKTTARSALEGLVYGHTWRPEKPRITVLSDIKRQVIFAGEVDTNLFIGGVGTVLTDSISYTWGIQSIDTIS